ncbi:hypothetical protein [Vibrio algicola]|uniref:KfrA N-terminal DNA-binding domain-containing protein n=1 Tax=Vibrio algicola TaxID=2662262 RepID=A0A5Q0TCD3_9VIBR|nr:hypothetical protein [Vibrio algicola]
MNTQNITEELHQVLSALRAEGKEPSVALVKARMSVAVPMPAIISTIKSWKASNRVPKVEIAAQQPVNDSDAKILQLEQQILDLLQRVTSLEQQLKANKEEK